MIPLSETLGYIASTQPAAPLAPRDSPPIVWGSSQDKRGERSDSRYVLVWEAPTFYAPTLTWLHVFSTLLTTL